MHDAILRARALLQAVTPLEADCGQACGGCCCRATAQSCGMLLFPGEEQLPMDTGFIVTEAAGGSLLTCTGQCDRTRRPLACRFFPLFPHLGADGRVRAVYDPRGWRLCPLLRQRAHVPLRRDFVRAVRRAGRILTEDPAAAAFLRQQSREIDELVRLLPPGDGRTPIMRRKLHE